LKQAVHGVLRIAGEHTSVEHLATLHGALSFFLGTSLMGNPECQRHKRITPHAIDLATLKRPLVYDVIVNTGNTLCGLQLHGTMEGKMILSSEIELHSHGEICFAIDPKARHLHDKYKRDNSDRCSLECTTQLHVVFEFCSLALEVLVLCFSLIFFALQFPHHM